MATTETNTIDEYEDDDCVGCECEIDWNCGCGRYGGFTYIETRYDSFYDDPRGF